MRNLNNILLIDDDKNTNLLNTLVIKSINPSIKIDLATDGEQALNALIEMTKNKNLPDLILLDINMPKLNGWELLDKFKQELNQEPQTNIIVLSSSSNPNDFRKIKNYSCVKHFEEKPLTKTKMNNIINTFHQEFASE